MKIPTPFLKIRYPVLEIEFNEYLRKGSPKTVIWLFEELGKRLESIAKKYDLELDQETRKKDIKIEFIAKEASSKILILGYQYIPLKSFGNMLSIILWSFIVYKTGKKPSEDETVNLLHKEYLEDFDEFKKYWNRQPRKKIPLDHIYRCYICGKEAVVFNKWKYTHKANVEDIFTPVCETHKDNLL